jgi:hypothetical protein
LAAGHRSLTTEPFQNESILFVSVHGRINGVFATGNISATTNLVLGEISCRGRMRMHLVVSPSLPIEIHFVSRPWKYVVLFGSSVVAFRLLLFGLEVFAFQLLIPFSAQSSSSSTNHRIHLSTVSNISWTISDPVKSAILFHYILLPFSSFTYHSFFLLTKSPF